MSERAANDTDLRSDDPTEREEELELRHLRGVAARFELDATELRRLTSDLDEIHNRLDYLAQSRSILERLFERLLPNFGHTRQLLISTINVLQMNLEEVARLLDAQREADQRQLLDLVDGLVTRLADIDAMHARLRALEQSAWGDSSPS